MAKATEKVPRMFEHSMANLLAWLKALWVVLLLYILALVIPRFGQIASIGDTAIFYDYSVLISNGLIPYRDFIFEYPPGSIFFTLVPHLLSTSTSGYPAVFSMLAGLAMLGVVRHLWVSQGVRAVISFAVVLIPLLGLAFYEFDTFSAAALYASLIVLAQKKLRLSAVLFGVAVLIKGYPIVLLPAILAFMPRPKIKKYLAVLLFVVALGSVPFMVISPEGVWESASYQLSRPLQIESGPAVIGFIFGDYLGDLTSYTSHKSYALAFPHWHLVSNIFSATMLALTLVLSVWFFRMRYKKALGLKCLALLIGFVLFFKVGSPQYLLPIIMVSLVAGLEIEPRQKLQLTFRLFLIGVTVIALFMNYYQLTLLQLLPEVLVILRYVLLIELLVWVIRRLRNINQAFASNLLSKN